MWELAEQPAGMRKLGIRTVVGVFGNDILDRTQRDGLPSACSVFADGSQFDGNGEKTNFYGE